MIYHFMSEAVPGRIEMILETKAGNNKLYQTFEEFEEDIDVVLSLKDQVQKILMIASEVGPEKSRLIWISIEFIFNMARFNIFASDDDGSLREWTDSSYQEMQRLFELFRPSPAFQELIKRDFYEVYPDRRGAGGRSTAEVFGRRKVMFSESEIRRYLEGVVVFDYDANIKDRIFNELSGNPVEKNPEPKIGRRWIKDRSIWIGIIGSCILLLLLLLSIYL